MDDADGPGKEGNRTRVRFGDKSGVDTTGDCEEHHDKAPRVWPNKDKRLHIRLTIAIAAALLIPSIAIGTSVVGCLNRGVELRSDFMVEVSHADKPLPGVSVEVKGGPESAWQLYAELTDADGRVRFKNLPPGDYWVKAELLGIGAGYECFHINPSPSRKAKKRRRYEWGDMPVGVRQAAGRFIDSKPGNEGTPIQRIIHRVDVPVAGVQLELHQPFDGTVYKTVTDLNGRFLFDNAVAGIYVLHIVAIPTSTESTSDSSNFLIRIGDGAKPGTILLRNSDAITGGTGGTSLQIEANSSPNS